MAIKFSSLSSSSIAFVCLDITENISDPYIKELTKNLADYTVQNLLNHGFDVYIDRRYSNDNILPLDNILRDIKDNYSHAVVYTNDTEFEGGAFFNSLQQLVKEPFFAAGHILGRSNFDAYYEIHDQCFIVNLEVYKSLDCPTVGDVTYSTKRDLRKLIPSQEHYHDNYTPKHVAVSDIVETYKNLPFGWNWINTGHTLKVFDDSIRNSKKNYYAQYPEEFHKNFSYNIRKHQYASSELFYPANTERVTELKIDSVDQIVVPSSGLNFLYYLDKHGYTNDTEVIFYDNNSNSLRMMRKIIEEFDGENYVEFVNHNCTGIVAGNEAIQDHWNNFKRLWHIVNKVQFRYENIDAMYMVPQGLRNSANTIYNLTNIFLYEPNSAFRSLYHRISSQNTLFKYLQSSYSDVNIIISTYADSGIGWKKPHSLKAEELKQISSHELMLPRWHHEANL